MSKSKELRKNRSFTQARFKSIIGTTQETMRQVEKNLDIKTLKVSCQLILLYQPEILKCIVCMIKGEENQKTVDNV